MRLFRAIKNQLALAGLLTAVSLVGAAARAQVQPRKTEQAGAALRPGDVVKLRIWREPDLSGDFVVDRDGIVTLPRLGARSATKIPSDSLRAEILHELQKYLTNPSIAVDVMRRVSVAGGVRQPGVYLVDEVMTVADLITLAGGTVRVDVRNVRLVRNSVETGQEIPFTMRLSSVPVRSGDGLFVARPSWFQANYQMVYVAVSSAVALATLITLINR